MATDPKRLREEEWVAPWWKHPYLIYIALTTLLFALLILAGWLAWTNGWIPGRTP